MSLVHNVSVREHEDQRQRQGTFFDMLKKVPSVVDDREQNFVPMGAQFTDACASTQAIGALI